MVTKILGELDWEEADLGGNDFMRLEEGSNVVRIFTKPFQFYVIWTADATGKQRKFRSAIENCPLVQRGETPQARWFVGALDRRNNKPMVLEIGTQIYKQILGLKKKKAWGDPRTYDIDIERQPKGSQPLYVVSPEPKSSLTNDEKGAIKEFLSRVDLVKLTEPPTPEEVREQLGISESKEQVDDDFDNFDTDLTDDDDFNFNDM